MAANQNISKMGMATPYWVALVALAAIAAIFVKVDSASLIIDASANNLALSFAEKRCEPQSDNKQKYEICVKEQKEPILYALSASVDAVRDKISSELVPSWLAQFLAVGVGGALFLLLGMKRFESLDEQLERFRKEVGVQLIEAAQKQEHATATGRADFEQLAQNIRQEIDERVDKISHQRAAQAAEDAVVRMERDISTKIDISLDKVTKMELSLTDVADKFDSKYGWLTKYDNREATFVDFNTVQEANIEAVVAFEQRNNPLAFKILEQIPKLETIQGDATDYFNASTTALQHNAAAIALQIVDAGLVANPKNQDLLANKARILIDVGQQTEANKIFADLISSEDNVRTYWRITSFLSDLLISEGRYPEAFAALDRYANLSPGSARPWVEKGLLLEKLGRRDEAIEAIAKGIQAEPFETGALYNYARLFYEKGDAAQAKKAIDSAFLAAGELQPSMSLDRVCHLRGLIYERLAREAPTPNASDYLLQIAIQSYKISQLFGEDGHVKRRARERLKILAAESGMASPPEGLPPGIAEAFERKLAEMFEATSS